MAHTISTRRGFLRSAGAAAGAVASAGFLSPQRVSAAVPTSGLAPGDPPFRISLAEWSLHKTLWDYRISNLEFPKVARQEFGIDAVEYVNQFFKDKARDEKYLKELNRRCDGEGVKSLLIMVDGEGQLGDANEARRNQAVENHHQWVEAAKKLGCHSIRVNAASSGSYEEQQKRAADGLARLGEYADKYGLNVIVENHGGLSSHGEWLAGVMKMVGRPNVGTLPDFGNFNIGGGHEGVPEQYDRYQGVEELMPYAKAVSAKSHKFNTEGNEVNTDYFKMMKIVLEAGYHGYVGIEWEGGDPGEYEGIRLTKKLLERVRDGIA